MWASYKGHEACLAVLLDAGANVDAANSNGATPVYVASQEGHESCLALLIDAGADINKATDSRGATPLLAASEMGHEGNVARLIEAGAASICQRGWQRLAKADVRWRDERREE